MKRSDIYDLKIGDRFVEEDSGMYSYCQTVRYEDRDYGHVLIGLDLLNNREISFFYNLDAPAYAPCVWLLDKHDNPLKMFGAYGFN